MRTVHSADGTKIAFDQTGQGPPVILMLNWRSSLRRNAVATLSSCSKQSWSGLRCEVLPK